MPIQWVTAFLTGVLFDIPGSLLSYFVVPFAILFGWDTTVFGKKIFWPWDCVNNPATGDYHDPWYGNPNSSTHHWLSLWCWNHPKFFRRYYWSTRNAFSNGSRYCLPWKQARKEDIYLHTYSNGYYQYDTTRPWLGKLRITLFKDQEYYIGFKFERNLGFGVAHRGIIAVITVVSFYSGIIYLCLR